MIKDYFYSIDFAWPWVLFLLLLIPAMAFWYWTTGRRKKGSLLVSNTGGWTRKNKSLKVRLQHLPFLLRMVAIACIILALARPQTHFDEERVQGEGVDIVMALDVSGSMLAQDFSPNRLEAAKAVAIDFVNSRKTDRVGVVIFSGESFTLVPLTTDKNVLRAQIDGIQSGLLEDGTAIGSGLATSSDRLRLSKSKSKVVILLTDGENNGGQIPPVTAKEIAKNLGIKVYTIGVGSEGYAPIPVQDGAGRVVMQREKVNIDEKLLTEIANETGGKYFRVSDNEGLSKVYNEIDELEKSTIEVSSLRQYTDRYLPLAIVALCCLFLEWVLRLTLLRKLP